MALSTKQGNGGHGLEVFDTETGKYTQVDINFNGSVFSGWEQLRDFMVDSDPDIKSRYNSDSNFKQQIDDYIQDEIYPQLLQEEVDRINSEGERYVEFKDPEDAAINMDKLFSNTLIDTFVANDIVNKQSIQVNPLKTDYVVNNFAACFQMCRFKGNGKMNPISKAEYDQRSKNFGVIPALQRGGRNSDELFNYIKNAKEVPLNRGQHLGNSRKVWEEVKRAYWDENSPIKSFLSHDKGVNCSYFGSCTYMGCGNKSYSLNSYSFWLHAIAKPQEMKIMFIRDEYRSSIMSIDTPTGKFIKALESNEALIKEKIVNKLVNSGKFDNNQSNIIVDRLFDNILNRSITGSGFDCGLMGIIMGYDAICADGFQFDILNPNKIDVVYDWDN